MSRTTIRSEDITAGAVDTSDLETDIALLGFKVAANGSLAAYELSKQTVDSFEDESGIDAVNSVNKVVSNANCYGAITNYAGDSSDGSLSTTGNVTHTVQNTNGSYDGDMVVKQYSSLTINSGHTMTVNQPCRGMFIYVSGNCVINGTLSMTGKGGASDPTVSGGSDSNAVGANGLQLGLLTDSGTDTFTNDGTGFNGAGTAVRTATANTANISGNGTIFSISKLGATGPTGPTTGFSYADGNNGTTGGATISTGSGGTGQTGGFANGSSGSAGDGGDGGAFSGGAGGGGSNANSGGTAHGGDGGNYGGAGGDGAVSLTSVSVAGGAGNPGGSTVNEANYGPVFNAPTGVGGIIWLVVGGNLTIGAAGKIEAKGLTGGSAYVDGGSSGGGAIFVLHTGTYTVDNLNTTPISAAGGIHDNAGQNTSRIAGDGGAGGFHVAQLGKQNANLTLVSNASTADAAPDKADIVMAYTNGAGTATINTDLKAYVSRDGGTTWTQATLVADGTSGGHSILVAHNIDISSQPSGTSMKYKIETLNQSASKETRIQAVSLGWK